MSIAETLPPLAATAARYRARLTAFAPGDWMAGAATPFQRREWLTPFFQAVTANLPDTTPFVAEVTDEAGRLVYRLPLLRQHGRITFADLHMTDFNAPLSGLAMPRNAADAARAFRALRAALPPHRLLHLAKMPGTIGGAANPLLLAARSMLSAVNGNLLVTGDDWDSFHFGLERTFRKEQERCWRVFARAPGAQFRAITDTDEALRTLETMEALQRARMTELGQPYGMDDPVTADFYRRLLTSGIESGFAHLSVLQAGGETVSALLGVRDESSFVMIRLVHAGGAWSKVSPGRVLIHKTLEKLHGEGWRRFDFSIGNYAYKRRFGPVRTPLYDIAVAGNPLGLPAIARIRAGALLRRHPQAREAVRRLLGKPPSREEN